MKLLPLQLVDAWRSQLNPLRGLTMSAVADYLDAGDRGDYPDLQWLFRKVEKRDAVLRACKRRLTGAVLKLDWDIKVIDGLADDRQSEAQAQADFLREAYERITNFREALRHLVLSEFRGYAHLEKVWEAVDGQYWVRELRPVPQWHWSRDGIYGAWVFLSDAQGGWQQGASINRENFVVREVDDPVDEIALVCFLRKSLSEKDWDAFCEQFGIPWVFATLPPNMPDDAAERALWLAEMEQLTSGSRGLFPHGTDPKVASAPRGATPFEAHLKRQDEQVVLAATSGKLTMLSEATGIGSGASDQHQDTFDDLAEALAGDLSEAFQRDFDRPMLARRFGEGTEPLVYFEIRAKDEEDINELIAQANGIKTLGATVDLDELSERTGIKIVAAADAPAPDQPAPNPPETPVRNRLDETQALADAALQEIASAEQEAFAELIAAIESALAIEDETERRRQLADIRAELPAMGIRALTDERLLNAWDRPLAEAFVAGFRHSHEETQPGILTRIVNALRTRFTR